MSQGGIASAFAQEPEPPRPAPVAAPAPHTAPCADRATMGAYLAAAAWIGANGSEQARAALAFHRETVEPRRGIPDGGDGTLKPCVVSRRRLDLVRTAHAEGMPGQHPDGVDLVIPLGTGSQSADAELRYLLRSANANMLGLRLIHVIGPTRPAWLVDHQRLRWHQWAQTEPKNHDIIGKFLYAASHPDVSETFVGCCDDWCFLRPARPVAEWGAVQRGGVLSAFTEGSRWKTAQSETRRQLEDAGRPVLFYDTHTPSVMTKTGWMEVEAAIPWRNVPGHAVWSLYHNVAGVHGPVLGVDARAACGWHCGEGAPETVEDIEKAATGHLFASYDTAAFTPTMQAWLATRFPDPAPWEQPERPALTVTAADAIPRVTEFGIRIPWRTDKDLGAFYNQEMERCPPGGWVLFLDHDVLVLTKDWYAHCLAAINANPGAGLFTCRTNRGSARSQRDQVGKWLGEDILAHIRRAEELLPLADTTIPYQRANGGWGFFMLVARDCWNDINFTHGFARVDTRFFASVYASRWKVYLLNGVYAYHVGITNSVIRSLAFGTSPTAAADWATRLIESGGLAR